jgi:hypothetical protein
MADEPVVRWQDIPESMHRLAQKGSLPEIRRAFEAEGGGVKLFAAANDFAVSRRCPVRPQRY